MPRSFLLIGNSVGIPISFYNLFINMFIEKTVCKHTFMII